MTQTGGYAGLAVALFAAGCFVPKEAGFGDVKNMVAQRGIARIHWNQGSEEDQKVAAHVRELLRKELKVASATQIALLNNPRLQATYERLGVAQADLVQAGLLRNPTFSLDFHFPTNGGQRGYEFSIIGEFLDLFLIPVRKRFARAELERTKLEVGDAVLELATQVRAAFYSVQAAQQIVSMRESILEAAQASAELAGRQFEAGNLSELDLANEQGVYVQAQLDLARSQAGLLGERERMTRLLGVWGRDTEWKISAQLADIPREEPALEHLESFAVAHRLDLSAAREEVRIASAALSLMQRTRIVNAVGVGGHIEKDPEGITYAGPNLEVQLPIFDQGQARIARLRSELRHSQKRLESRAIDIRSEVRVGRGRLLATRSAVEYQRSTVLPIRERIVALSQQQYNAMLIGVYQLLQAKQNEINAYSEYIEAVRSYWIARSELERAIGGPLPETKEAPAAEIRQGDKK